MEKIIGYAGLAMSDIETFEPAEGFESLEEKALFGCQNLKRIVLPSTFNHWGHDCVGGCDDLRAVYLHENITGDIVARARYSLPGDVRVFWGNKEIPLVVNTIAV